jgi:hypothetical protein
MNTKYNTKIGRKGRNAFIFSRKWLKIFKKKKKQKQKLASVCDTYPNICGSTVEATVH